MSFLLESLIFLMAALVVVPICRRLGLSSVLGYLGAGLLIGPSGLGAIGDAEGVLHFSEIGVVLLLFLIGLELRPRRLWVMRRVVFGLGTAQVAATTGVLTLALHAAFGLALGVAVLIAFALSLSSTAFVLQLLGEQKKLNHTHGRAAFGILLLQDVAVIPAIAVLSLTSPPSGGAGGASGPDPIALAAAVAGLIAARFTLRPALRFIASTGIHELFVAAGLAIVVGSALAMQTAGLSMGLGAFIAGMLVADSEYRHQLEADVMPFKGLLMGLFFMAVGMSANLALLREAPVAVLGLTLGLIVLKFMVLLALARWHGLTIAEAARTAAVLSQGGEFAFVLLGAGAASALLTREAFDLAALVVTLSMAATPLVCGAVERMLRAGGDPERPFDVIDEPENPVIIAGFGRFAQIVARILTMQHIPFTALEANPTQVDFVRSFGNEIYFGDATRLDLLRAAHVAEARAFVLAIDDVEASVKVATLVRETCPKVAILARARNRHHELQLRELGVRYVVRETLHSSLRLTESLLEHLGRSPERAVDAVEAFRVHDRATLDKQAAVFHDEKAFRQTTLEATEELKQLFRDDASS
jgi:glutathione-regulated potassium-efflux system ancillary protein KefC/glutathione-regulated potassium-efflux system protein KefB